LKLLVVTHSYYPSFQLGGPSRSIHLINRYLVRNGIKVMVISTNAGLRENEGIKFNKWNNIDGVDVKYFNTYGNKLYNVSPGMLIELYKKMDDSDLVHISPLWNFPCIVAGLISRLKKKKYVLSPRGTLNKESFNIKNSLLKKTYYKLLAERIVKGSSAIHFTSEDEMMNVTNYLELNQRSFVVPNGINLEEYKESPEPGNFKKKHELITCSKYILFMGRIHKKKGIDILIKAFKILNDKFKDIKLVIAGFDNDGYECVVREMVASLKLDNEVIFTGPLYKDEIKEAFTDAECFVLPSYSENFGMAVIEAMAMGCPVVVSNRVGIYDVIKKHDAGVVVEANETSLFQGICSLIDSSELRRELSERGKILVNDYYEIDKVAKKMIANYESLLQ